MSTPFPPRNRRGFKVAIICALKLEAENVRAVFDRCWEDEGKQYNQAEGDQNAYTTGVIGKHNVVLAHMPDMGSISAATAAAGLRSSFPGIQLALVVGICGVVPIHPKTQEEIVLGDIVISTAVIQYDFGRQYPNGFRRKKEIEDSLGRASPAIRSFINMLRVRHNHRRLTRNLTLLLQSENFQTEVPAAKYPGAIRDRLYEASYIHQHRPGVSCDNCNNSLETCSKSCDELGCEEEKLIARNRLSFPKTEDLSLLPDDIPLIHFGKFGSANIVMKSGVDRDWLAESDGVIAFEMEGAGVWDQHPTVVIKAACDYADSHKNKDWQDYAAAMAAAGLKVLLKEWTTPDQLADRDESPGPIWHVPFDQLPGFVGRTDEIEHLKWKIFETGGRRVVSVLGLGGIGKSRLALELAYQIKSEHPQHSIFWIQAADQLTFERDVLEIGKKLRIPGIEDDKTDTKSLFKQSLSSSSTDQWLLILDNADDEALWGDQSDSSPEVSSLVEYLPKTTNGSIIITTRTRGVANFLAGKEVIELPEMSPHEGAEMFTEALQNPGLAVDRVATLTLLEKLAFLPLAIVQAASFINMTQRPVQTYVELLDEPEAEVIKLLSKDFGDPSRYPNAKNPIATTWLISFNHILKHHQLAARFLSSMACLHEKNIPRSLLPEAGSKIDIIDAITTLTGYSFVRRQTSSNGLGDGEELYNLHRLVQLAARNWLKLKGSLTDWMRTCITRIAQVFPTRDYKHKSIWTVYLPHAQRLCEENEVEHFPDRYRLLEKMGLCFVVDGKYDEAVKAHTATVQWREYNLGASEQQTLEAYNNLGEALNWKGDRSAAERYLQKALKGQREIPKAEHPSTLTSMANLASTYRNQGRWQEAEELDVQVMETRKRVLGAEHPSTLTIMETSSRVLGAEHPSTLTSMANLASTYRNQGRWQDAEELEVQVMETRKRVLGAEHPDTLTSMANLASTYRNQRPMAGDGRA
ncbi:uncharacterized protein Z518_10046 [Rhinocladiella mackenziei CBS 650.93]|uniref:Nucleoside phosphorylase domain-containing protein n=1 Tax=Rhinocladiella mackenziei CBS 650.93 TaxID=1442369 RepID=A0A0D2IWH3_9EURO|nr:uncharacterized protein Z518_10046 [Rhinocladiella mackenziei CBS 650.93]KIX00980.1 hypothetical protein Z518_10046 [Rhinocladiella mackenziei CBS 650.93]